MPLSLATMFDARAWGKRVVLAIAVGLFFSALPAQGQLRDLDPDWEELQAPAPPTYDVKRGVFFELLNSGTELRWSIDPKTISLGSDGVTRYVVMATSISGTIHVFFEAINCVRAEVKTYARINQSGQWVTLASAQWKRLNGGLQSRHALALAHTALCEGATPRIDLDDIVQKLKFGPVPARNR